MSDIDALVREREGYLARGRPDRVAQVDAELRRLGFAVGRIRDEDMREAAVNETPERAVKARPRRSVP
jgi:hypothetical protein